MNIEEQPKVMEISVLPKQDLTKKLHSVKRDFAKYWTKEYINQQLTTIKNSQHKMLFITLWKSGIRITEAITLRKRDLDFESYLMTVRWLKSRKYNNRIVPLHPTLKEQLEIYVGTLKEDDRLFPITRQRAWQLCQKHFKGNPHMLRHSFSVNWLKCGGDLVTLHRVLGHSKVQTTMEYLKIVPIDQGKELIKIQF